MSPVGRVNRRTFVSAAAVTVVAVIAAVAIDRALGLADPELGAGPVYYIVALVSMWPMFATAVKRLHDQGRAAGWVAFAFLPIIGQLPLLLALLFVPGNANANAHGLVPAPGFAL
jgi:uncharacterized membrane protein YhaH (DUF805 family)